MALIKPPFDNNRTELRKVIPLSGPYSISIEPTRLCNLKCFYCIHATRGMQNSILERMGIPLKHMDMDIYKKLIHDIMEFPEQPKRILFSGLGEPLVNPYLSEMISGLRKVRYSGRIDINTNGTLLTPEYSSKLLDAGITRILISLQGLTSEKYEEVSGVPIDVGKYIDNIRWLFEHKKDVEIYVKIIDANLQNKEDKELFYKLFDGISDVMYVEHLMKNQQFTVEFRNDSGISTNKDMYGYLSNCNEICAIPFYTITIASDGTVYPCFPGFSLPMKFSYGKLNNKNSLIDIWNGDKRMAFLKKTLRDGKLKIEFCDNCDCIINGLSENLDKYSEELLTRLEGISDV